MAVTTDVDAPIGQFRRRLAESKYFERLEPDAVFIRERHLLPDPEFRFDTRVGRVVVDGRSALFVAPFPPFGEIFTVISHRSVGFQV